MLAGNYIHYGVREFGMSAIMNGMALHGAVIPYGGTFLVSSDYARNAMRMSALMKQRVIYVMTHDSIGLGEDGPTHQPVEHLPSLRIIPNMTVWRPCDSTETAVAWADSIERKNGPSTLALTRQALPPQPRTDQQIANIRRGGYVLKDSEGTPDVILIATGSEVAIAVEAAGLLQQNGKRVRVVSMPSTNVFEAQDEAYREQVLPRAVEVRVAIEAAATETWYRYVGRERRHHRHDARSARPASAKDLFKHFGFTADNVVRTVHQAAAVILTRQHRMPIKVGINGYGRIGRNVLRALYEANRQQEIQIVAINDLGDAQTNAHLTRYDTAHGKFTGDVNVDGDELVIKGDRIKVLAERDPAKLPWGQLGVDFVFECTGLFTSKAKAGPHLPGGAKKVIISALGGNDVDAHLRLRREPQPAEVEPHSHLQRLVHDQLPRAARQGAAREDRYRTRPDERRSTRTPTIRC